MESPYVAGSSLQLRLPSRDVIQVKIHETYEPLSMAVVLRVNFVSDPPPYYGCKYGDVAILKLYDRRFASDLRRFHDAKPYDLIIQDEYEQDVLTNTSTNTQGYDDGNGDDNHDESEVEKLRDIQKRCLEQAAAEKQVYERLKPLQEVHKVPRYYSAVELVVQDSAATLHHLLELSSLVRDYLRIPGCLISFVDGFLLSELQLHAPAPKWKSVIAAATAIVNEIGDYSVLNEDIRPTNVFVTLEKGEYKTVIFDFAQARLRRKEESDSEWREHKWMADEEGAIGYVMYVKLGLGEFEKTKQGSLRYRVRADEMTYYFP